ncbi:hypothetical protein SAMN04488055_2121 [Chitinophaga niabensis]|uniref:Uncharacterized protein n=1 Tax=Chitinophaga niabensis TaxID=536979 RepID=A0A1N6FB17_9BACT|nr:hypothetical protein SAMN04488055_2121 [Chitinophaga niabensis]
MIPNRIVIYIRDIQNITGRSENGARSLMDKIKKAYGKKQRQFVTLTEFCEYSGMDEEEVKLFLKR